MGCERSWSRKQRRYLKRGTSSVYSHPPQLQLQSEVAWSDVPRNSKVSGTPSSPSRGQSAMIPKVKHLLLPGTHAPISCGTSIILEIFGEGLISVKHFPTLRYRTEKNIKPYGAYILVCVWWGTDNKIHITCQIVTNSRKKAGKESKLCWFVGGGEKSCSFK